MAPLVHGFYSGQQQGQVDGEARRFLVGTILQRVEALRLRQEVLGDVEVQQAILGKWTKQRWWNQFEGQLEVIKTYTVYICTVYRLYMLFIHVKYIYL